jgi:hypothetical protein
MLFDPFKDPNEPFLGYNQCISIHQKDPVLPLHVLGGEKDIAQDDLVVFDGKSLVFVGPAKGALIVRTSKCHLEQDAEGLAGRPDAGSFIVHAFALCCAVHNHSLLFFVAFAKTVPPEKDRKRKFCNFEWLNSHPPWRMMALYDINICFVPKEVAHFLCPLSCSYAIIGMKYRYIKRSCTKLRRPEVIGMRPSLKTVTCSVLFACIASRSIEITFPFRFLLSNSISL